MTCWRTSSHSTLMPNTKRRIAIAAVLLAGGVVYACGEVYRDSFSPDSLLRRSSWRYEIPFARIPVTPWVHHEGRPTPVAVYLRQAGYWKDAEERPHRWDYIRGSRFGGRGSFAYTGEGSAGDALHAVRLLGNYELIDWSENHPEIAARVWPVVVENIEGRCYFNAYWVTVIAEGSSSLDEFDDRLDAFMQSVDWQEKRR